MVRVLLFFSMLVTASLPTTAENAAPPPPPPDNQCDDGGHYNDFDFWLGEWQVFGGPDKDQFAGENSIRKIEKGCIVHEQWRGNRNSSGQSFNFYNPNTGKWRQVWVAPPGYMIDISGGLVEGSMVLEGEIFYYGQGGSKPFRGTWTPNEDGSVRQYFQQYDADKKTWNDWFDGRYVRKPG